MIIAFLGKSIKVYRQKLLVFLERTELHCPYCTKPTHWHCWYKRRVKGEDSPIRILRVKCTGCAKTHAVIPDFLSPCKHYPLTVQESVIEQVMERGVAVEHVEIPAADGQKPLWPSIDTMRRWIRRYRKQKRRCMGAIAAFLERHGQSTGFWRPSFRALHVLIALAEKMVRHPIAGSCLFGKANILLTVSQPRLWF